MLYLPQMPSEDSVFDKAEAAARKLIDRLGSRFEGKSPRDAAERLNARQIGAILAQLENAVDSNLQRDEKSTAIAPNRFRVLLTYEETSGFTQQYMKAVAGELTSEVQEYIANRRYRTRGPIVVDLDQNLFSENTTVKASFDGGSPENERSSNAVSPAQIVRTVRLIGNQRSPASFELQSGSVPISIGRAAGNALRLDDDSVSRAHCSIAIKADGSILISDLGSANGTSVNGKLLKSGETCLLQDGDNIQVGDVAFKVAISD